MTVRIVWRAGLVVSLVALIYVLDRVTGIVPDLTALYLVPVILATLWFGIGWGLGLVVAALAAQILAHPAIHRPVIIADAATHLAVFGFAAVVTAQLLSQMRQIRVLNERREADIEVARQVFEGLSEQEGSLNPRLELVRRLTTAQDLGGDYVFVRDTERGTFLCLSDISGKGISAALFTALLQASISTALEMSDDPRQVVRSVNDRMYDSLPSNMFITALCLLFSDSEVTFVNAGHEAGLLVPADGGPVLELFSDNGLPLGIQAELVVEPSSVPFRPGDLLVAYTDGLVDSPGFRGDRASVLSAVAALAGRSAEQVADSLFSAALRDGEPHRDDATIAVVRRV